MVKHLQCEIKLKIKDYKHTAIFGQKCTCHLLTLFVPMIANQGLIKSSLLIPGWHWLATWQLALPTLPVFTERMVLAVTSKYFELNHTMNFAVYQSLNTLVVS